MAETMSWDTSRLDRKDISIVSELMYQLKVREVMTRNVCTVTPAHTLRDVQHVMRDRRISGVPVVENNKLVGIVSLDDIIRALDTGEIGKSVDEKMTRKVCTVHDNVSVVKAIDEMEKSGFGRLPVLDARGRLVGILTHWDVVRKLLVMLQEVALQAEQRERDLHGTAVDGSPGAQGVALEFDIDKDDFENAGIASSTVKKQLQSRNVPAPIIRRIAVAMYEAEMNMIIHSLGGKMFVTIFPDRVLVKAIDRGPGIADVELAMKEGFSTASEKVREMGFGAGMGLSNIKRCADRFDIKSSLGTWTELTIEVDLAGTK
ncbi:CBS domain-containing protein [bacterium]|nr:CBS domain-containing protein [bacterium]